MDKSQSSHAPAVDRAAPTFTAARFDWADPFLFEDQLSEEERLISEQSRRYAQDSLMPRIVAANRAEQGDRTIFEEMGALGLLGAFIDGYRCAGVGFVGNGLIMRELERADTSYRSAANVQGMVMDAIRQLGSPEQRERLLPELAAGRLVGAYGLTEPDHGSDPSAMKTRARHVSGGWRISGTKTWISHAPIADVFVVWARDDDGRIRGFLLERGVEGLSTVKIEGKFAMRASPTGQILLEDVFVAEADALPEAQGLRSALGALNNARFGICWGVWGSAEFCWMAARDYALSRTQFGRPIAANQLIQSKLVDMQTEIALGLQAVLRVSRLRDEGRAAPEMLSILKRHGAARAYEIARMAREIHGGNGISDEYHVVRHQMNMDVVNTLEGTREIHTLVLGRAQTGINAFAG